MRKASQRLEHVAPSKSMASLAAVARLRSEGHEIMSLAVGEPDFRTPIHIIEAAITALRRGDTKYLPTNGIPELRKAIRKHFNAAGLHYDDREVTIAAGAKQLIFTALAATVDPGDEIVIPAPYWLSYPDMGALFGAKIVFAHCRADDQFKLTPAGLGALLTPRTRWVILNSPNNPTGSVYSAEELKALGSVLEEYPDCLVLSDDIYQHLIFDGRSYTPFAVANPGLKQRVLTVNGVSKAYSMTGFRLGYAGGPAWLVTAINTILTQDTTCPSSISQFAAVAALTGDQSSLVANVQTYQERRDVLVGRLNLIPGVTCSKPAGAFYALASVAGLIGSRTREGDILHTDEDLAAYFLREARVATLAGSAFGAPNYLRLSFATSIDVIERASNAMSAAVDLLNMPGGP